MIDWRDRLAVSMLADWRRHSVTLIILLLNRGGEATARLRLGGFTGFNYWVAGFGVGTGTSKAWVSAPVGRGGTDFASFRALHPWHPSRRLRRWHRLLDGVC